MNCSFNIRYKPRTTRVFTKSDLTVYDSADNTALNALTVYGKSEVVDGAITSAGEGWSTVDLGTWNWYLTSDGRIYAPAKYDIKKPASSNDVANVVCAIFKADTDKNSRNHVANKIIAVGGDNAVYVYDTDYTDPAAFKTAMNGVILAYEEATPTNNTIAIKTDNGSGTNGTMATFTTGTPLRGIPDTDVRDVMAWDGSSGEVTKNCGEVDLSSLEWARKTTGINPMFYAYVPNSKIDSNGLISETAYTKYPNTYASRFSEAYPDKAWCMSSATNQIFFRDDSILTQSDFTTAMSGVMLVYELATPTTEQLTSTENASIAGLRTFEPQTHAQNNARAEMTIDYTIKVPTI